MQFEPFEAGIEVSGGAVRSVIDGFRNFTIVGARYLLDQQIGTANPDGTVTLQEDAWYSQAAWLRAFRNIATDIGERVLFDIGQAIPRTAVFPPTVVDIVSGMQAIDIAFHMNHRKGGAVMFDPATGVMLEGIGHYGCRLEAPGHIVSVCENPYPCAFDRGIVTAMAHRFTPSARVTHDDAAPCRNKGASSCTYVVRW